MAKIQNFTEGPILKPMIKFALPIFAALFLQALYGATDLAVVGQFASSADVSAVSTGSQLLTTITNVISAFAMGVTVVLGRLIGEGKKEEAGKIIGSAITFLLSIGVVVTILVVIFAGALATAMKAPAEAYDMCTDYIRICGGGAFVIVAYNLIGSIFRGIGDSKTPFITVLIAAILNVVGDLILVAVFHMGAKGAAIATVFAQFMSVVLSVLILRHQSLPFTLKKDHLKPQGEIVKQITLLGVPIALQELLVGLSFLIIQAIVNNIGLSQSAGIGVAEKVCTFVMLIPSAFSQSMSAICAQNVGAKNYKRATKTLRYGIGLALFVSVFMSAFVILKGYLLTGIFSNDETVIMAAWDYLKAYGIDCLLTSFLFCFIGFFNGFGLTKFVMVQGIVGAFFVRIPVSYFVSRATTSLFYIGLATPCSSLVQILLCFGCLYYVYKKYIRPSETEVKTLNS